MQPVRFPWDITPAPVPVAAPAEAEPPAKEMPRGRRPRSTLRSAVRAADVAPDWLYHHLTVSGPADAICNFAEAARGSGIIPWRLDFADIEETVFTLAVAQPAGRRSLSIEGCRILARQFRDKVEAHQARAVARVQDSLACPFDLHRLLPVPDSILQLGPAHPDALAWLAAQWGITDRLRQVVMRDNATAGRRLPRGHRVIGYGFFTAGDTPHVAVHALAARWPALRLALRPRPAD
jgi:hypothetical protein